MTRQAIEQAVQARVNTANYSFMSNEAYAAEMQSISDWQDAMFRANCIFY